VSKLLKFNQFINESSDQSSKAEHYLGEPFVFWEKPMADLIEKIEELEDSFFYGRLNNLNQMKFNIKMYDVPDFQEIATKYGQSENQIAEDWYEYLRDRLEGWAHDLMEECPWIKDWNQDGRSGGWLVLETNIKDTKDELFELCRGYRWEKGDCVNDGLFDDDSIELAEMYYKMKDTSDLFSAVPEVLDRLMPDDQLKNILEFHSEMERIKQDVLSIEESIKEYKELIPEEFVEHMEETYGEND